MAIKSDKDAKSTVKKSGIEAPTPKVSSKSKKQLEEDDDDLDDIDLSSLGF